MERPFVQNAKDAEKYIPQSIAEFMNQERELDVSRVHVTQLLQPPQIAVLQPFFPDRDIQNKVRLALGIAFHEFTQENDRKFKKEIVFNSDPPHKFTLVGEPDFPESWKTMLDKEVDEYVADIKVTSVYKIKKCLEESKRLLDMEVIMQPPEFFREEYQNSFDWIWQASAYKYIGDYHNAKSALIFAVNFDAGNQRIKSSLSSENVVLDFHPIFFPLFDESVLVPDIKARWKKLRMISAIVNEKNLVIADRSGWEVELDKHQLRCSFLDTWGGARCQRYCNLKDVCFGTENSPEAKWSSRK
jgi:hypothetical protein